MSLRNTWTTTTNNKPSNHPPIPTRSSPNNTSPSNYNPSFVMRDSDKTKCSTPRSSNSDTPMGTCTRVSSRTTWDTAVVRWYTSTVVIMKGCSLMTYSMARGCCRLVIRCTLVSSWMVRRTGEGSRSGTTSRVMMGFGWIITWMERGILLVF